MHSFLENADRRVVNWKAEDSALLIKEFRFSHNCELKAKYSNFEDLRRQ